MAKQTKGKVTAPPPRTPKSPKRFYQGLLALAVIASVVAISFYASRDSSSVGEEGLAQLAPPGVTSANPALRNQLILPATPQRPRPITLPPEQFTEPEIHQAYLAAKETPDALESVACYCGCFSEARHRNNLDCYKDNHGVT